MLAPVPPKRSDGGSSFAALQKYLTERQDQETGEVLNRGEVMISDALLSAETAAAEMKAVAAEDPRCKDAVMHLVLSWQKNEHPTSEQWQEAVKHTMESLKDRNGASMADHQYMAVMHRDTENQHVHVMVCRVHPETYQANSPEWLHKTLDKSCREIEAAQGWQQDNGLYRWDEEKGKAVATTSEEREQKREQNQEQRLEGGTARTGKASKMEQYSNAESLETFCKGQPAKDLNKLMQLKDVKWQDVHATLAEYGLELHKGEKGGYTVEAIGKGIHVKASKVFRKQFAGKGQRAELDKKLGLWVQPKDFLKAVVEKKSEYSQHREPKRDPGERKERLNERAKLREALKAEHKEYKRNHYNEQKAKAENRKKIDKEKFAKLSREARETRAKIREMEIAPEHRKALLSVVAAEAVQAREQLRAELAEKRQQNKPKDYKTWVTELAKEGDQAAIIQLRGWQYQDKRQVKEIERRNAEIDRQYDNARADNDHRHDPADPRAVTDKSAALRMTWKVDTKTGDVEYQIDGQKAFTDHGERVSFGSGRDKDALEAGLKLAAQKYSGEIRLTGSKEFVQKTIEVAAERWVNVRFGDREQNSYYQAYKHQLEVEKEKEARQREPQEKRSQNKDRDMEI